MLHPSLINIMNKYPIPRIVVCSNTGFAGIETRLGDKNNIVAYELRLDLLNEEYGDRAEKVIHQNIKILNNKNIILTIRSEKEGGKFKGKLQEKVNLYQKYLAPAFALDIEIGEMDRLKDFIKEVKSEGKIIIGSYHNFTKVPSLIYLQQFVQKGEKLGADIVKIAVYADKVSQLIPLIELQKEEKKVPLSLMSMGKTSLLSRTVLAIEGSVWTYASLGKPTAPNQPTCKQIIECARTLFGL